MAKYNDALLTAMMVTNGIIDKMIADTGRYSATQILKLTAIRAKIDASGDISREDLNFLDMMLRKACSILGRTATVG